MVLLLHSLSYYKTLSAHIHWLSEKHYQGV